MYLRQWNLFSKIMSIEEELFVFHLLWFEEGGLSDIKEIHLTLNSIWNFSLSTPIKGRKPIFFLLSLCQRCSCKCFPGCCQFFVLCLSSTYPGRCGTFFLLSGRRKSAVAPFPLFLLSYCTVLSSRTFPNCELPLGQCEDIATLSHRGFTRCGVLRSKSEKYDRLCMYDLCRA